MTATEDPRRGQLAANLRVVRERVAAACARAGRVPAEVTLVAVTKTWPAADVVRLASLGIVDIGENRDQEAAAKAAEVAVAGVAVRWHFVGQLQRNKCRSVVRYAHLVHSVDGVRLAHTLDQAALRHRPAPLDVLVQVSLDADAGRGGAVTDGPDPDRLLDRVVATVVASVGLRLRGVMAVAPLSWQPVRAYARLAEIAAAIRSDHPDAWIVSAGMSDDLEPAIEFGSTHVRVGSALLGKRAMLL